jgi:hypothetical protein
VLDDTPRHSRRGRDRRFAEDESEACSGPPVARYFADELQAALSIRHQWVMLARRREQRTTPWRADQTFTWLALTCGG